jgi:hypothetical protein
MLVLVQVAISSGSFSTPGGIKGDPLPAVLLLRFFQLLLVFFLSALASK